MPTPTQIISFLTDARDHAQQQADMFSMALKLQTDGYQSDQGFIEDAIQTNINATAQKVADLTQEVVNLTQQVTGLTAQLNPQ